MYISTLNFILRRPKSLWWWKESILGFIVKFIFLTRIKYVKTKCLKVRDILGVVDHLTCGTDRAVLIEFNQALVRTNLDYGCIVHGLTRPSYLKRLGLIQNPGLRLGHAAFLSSPADSLAVAADELPKRVKPIMLFTKTQIKKF